MTPRVLTADQLKILASPPCQDVLQALRILGEGSSAEVAHNLGRRPASVHYHLKRLKACGLIRTASFRPTARKPEEVFTVVSTHLRLPKASADSGLARRTVLAGLRQVMRGYDRASIADPGHAHVIRTYLKLREADLEQFLEMIEAAVKFADEHRAEDGKPICWSSVVYAITSIPQRD